MVGDYYYRLSIPKQDRSTVMINRKSVILGRDIHRLRVFLRVLGLHGMIILFIGFAGLFSPLVSPHDPYATDLINRLKPPSAEYLFGTDALGRCMLSRILFGARISLTMGLSIVTLSLLTGGVLGMIAGYFGRWTDEVIMRFTDMFMSVPSLMIALVLSRAVGPGIVNMIWIVSLSMWPGYARMVRNLVMQIKTKHSIEVAVMTGLDSVYILRHHVIPAISAPMLVMATLGMGRTILMTSSLSFLGLGIVEPTPDWGAMLNNGATWIRTAPHLAVFPGLFISITVLAFNLLGERFETFQGTEKSA